MGSDIPTHQQEVIDLGPGMFTSGDHLVINYKGDNYYRACGAMVTENPDESGSTCVKRSGHPGHIHEDWDGLTREETQAKRDYGWHVGATSLETAVGEAIGAGSACWANLSGAGVFNDTEARNIVEQLVAYIRELGPIYG